MTVVAERVETAKQAELLRSLGFTQAQGHLIGNPMPSDNFVSLTLA